MRLKGLDNHGMGTVFEELIRCFNASTRKPGSTSRPGTWCSSWRASPSCPSPMRSGPALTVYDGAYGTGGLLTVTEETMTQLAA